MAKCELGQRSSIDGNSKRRSPYNEYSPGDKVQFSIRTLKPDGSLATKDHRITIGDIRGGGFFGRVLVPEDEDFVIKTSLPDPWHHLWRTINWDFKPFPAQSNEVAAQLEHLSTRLIHQVLPVLSEGKFYSPDSSGYTHLSTGIAQVVEKMRGRGPRFDLPENEFLKFRTAQKELTIIALNLGLEQAGQIHPDNPFSLANLWWNDEKGVWIWLDTIPAIPHKGWIKPLFHFKFHKDMRHWFYQKATTFNRIHTGYFLTEISRNRHLFSEETFQELKAGLELYDSLREDYERQQKGNRADFSPALRASCETAKDLIRERFILKILADPKFRQEKIETLGKIITDPAYRVSYFNRSFTLRGIETAFEEGIISQEERQIAWEMVDGKKDPKALDGKKTLAGLQLYYIVTGEILNVIEGSAYLQAIFTENKLQAAALGVFVGWVLPSILRPVSTSIIGKVTNKDLRVARGVSALPKVGSYLAVPAQLSVDATSKADGIWHYTVRSIITHLSKMSPSGSGGLGTQLEAELWEKLGKRLEKLGRPG